MLPVAWGEVFDKLTILQIKESKLTDMKKIENVKRERLSIEGVVGDRCRFPAHLDELIQQLGEINARLWVIEDSKRACERNQTFDEEFIRLARDVYVWNDQRAAVKRQINLLLGSGIVEEKVHPPYREQL